MEIITILDKILVKEVRAMREVQLQDAISAESILDELKNTPNLEKYITPEHRIEQVISIADGIRDGVDVTKFNDPEYNFMQMNRICEALKAGIDITKWINPSMHDKLMQQIFFGLKAGMSPKSIALYSDVRYNWKQAQEIRLGIKSGVDISKYANPRNNAIEILQASAKILDNKYQESEEMQRQFFFKTVNDYGDHIPIKDVATNKKLAANTLLCVNTLLKDGFAYGEFRTIDYLADYLNAKIESNEPCIIKTKDGWEPISGQTVLFSKLELIKASIQMLKEKSVLLRI
jgi:hypothetical protein